MKVETSLHMNFEFWDVILYASKRITEERNFHRVLPGKRCLRDLGGITSSSGHLKTPIKSSKYFLTSSASSSSRILQKTKLLANKKKKRSLSPPKVWSFLKTLREKHDEQSEVAGCDLMLKNQWESVCFFSSSRQPCLLTLTLPLSLDKSNNFIRRKQSTSLDEMLNDVPALSPNHLSSGKKMIGAKGRIRISSVYTCIASLSPDDRFIDRLDLESTNCNIRLDFATLSEEKRTN